MIQCDGQEEAPSSRTGQTGDRPVTADDRDAGTPNLPFPADHGNPELERLEEIDSETDTGTE